MDHIHATIKDSVMNLWLADMNLWINMNLTDESPNLWISTLNQPMLQIILDTNKKESNFYDAIKKNTGGDL